MRLITLYIISIISIISCNKGNTNAGQVVEIYLFQTFQTVPGKCRVDSSVSVLQQTALIKNQDIVSYSHLSYQFTLTDVGMAKINALKDFTAFAVTVDKEVMYYGILKQFTSSSSCDHSIVMTVDFTSNNKINMGLGYPGMMQGVPIDDQRNHTKLLATLASQGKLK